MLGRVLDQVAQVLGRRTYVEPGSTPSPVAETEAAEKDDKTSNAPKSAVSLGSEIDTSLLSLALITLGTFDLSGMRLDWR